MQYPMIASLPMQDHLDEAAFDAHDDLAQGGTNNPLARCRCRRRMRPGEFQIGAEPHQVLPLFLAQRRWFCCLHRSNFALDLLYGFKRFVPAALQLASHQTVGGIDGVVLPARMGDFITRSLQRELKLLVCGRHLAGLSLERLESGIDAERLQDAKDHGSAQLDCNQRLPR